MSKSFREGSIPYHPPSNPFYRLARKCARVFPIVIYVRDKFPDDFLGRNNNKTTRKLIPITTYVCFENNNFCTSYPALRLSVFELVRVKLFLKTK